MKRIDFSTSRGEFILVDSRGRDNYYEVLRQQKLMTYYVGMPEVMTDEQFSDVVDSRLAFQSEFIKDALTCYTDYLNPDSAFTKAKDSFGSLINSLGYYLFDNPYQYDWDELCRYGHGDFSKNGKSSYDLYMAAELKTFYNPILLKKI